MKTTIKILSLLLALIFVLPILTGCNVNDILSNFIVIEEEIVEEVPGGSDVVAGKHFVTVQWVQGQKVLREDLVEKGTTITPWVPEIEGWTFQDWYEKPYIKTFDFEKPVTESVRIYGSFLSLGGGPTTGGPEEMPDWYLIGAGKGDLGKCNNWNHEAAAANLGLFAGEDGIYKVTLSLYAGDQFKMTKDLGWDSEKAIDKMSGYANGSVTDANGNVVFVAGENNNFVLAEGMDGKYEISYDAENDVMYFKLIEALETLPDDIRLIGDANGWGTSYGEDDFKFTSTDGENWVYTWEVSTAPMTFKVYNNLSGVYYPGGVGNDLHIDVAGTYTIHFNSKTRNIVVKDSNGNTVDVGFSADNGGGNEGGGTTVTPNANPTDKVYVVIDSAWSDGSMMGAWVWPGDQWADFVATADPNVYEVSVPAGANMIIFVDFNGSEKNWDAKRVQTADLAVPDKSDDKIYYHVSNGTWSNSAESSGSTGGGNTGSGATTTEALTIYFRNDWLWTNVSCYYWGDGVSAPEWPGAAMNKVGSSDGYDVYAIELPAGVAGFIFNGVKNDGSGTVDQSPDILVDGLVNGQGFKMVWNGANAVEGFTYDPSACVHSYVGGVCSQCGARIAYTVAGTDNLCGTGWDTANTANDMEWDETEGVYKKVYTNLAVGTYEFKVVQDHSWGVNWGQGGQGGGNFLVDITADGCTLTVIFDGTTVSFAITQ